MKTKQTSERGLLSNVHRPKRRFSTPLTGWTNPEHFYCLHSYDTIEMASKYSGRSTGEIKVSLRSFDDTSMVCWNIVNRKLLTICAFHNTESSKRSFPTKFLRKASLQNGHYLNESSRRAKTSAWRTYNARHARRKKASFSRSTPTHNAFSGGYHPMAPDELWK